MAAKQAQALYDFDAQSPEELPLVADETITIINDEVGGGWWEARNQYGRSGLIPKDYVEILPENSLPEPSMPPPPLPAANPTPPSSDPPEQDDSSDQVDSQSSWNNHTTPSYTPNAATTYASAPAVDDDDWDDEDWSDDDGSSATTEQSRGPTNIMRSGKAATGDSGIRRKSKSASNKDTLKAGKPVSRLSNYNKLGFDSQLMSKDSQNVPENDKVNIIETHRGWEWEANRDPYTCLVDSPKKSSKLKGLKSFIVYQLTPSFSGIAVERRYKHFDWLHERFVEKYPTVVIPPLPDKQISGRYEDDFITERMKQLQEWVTRITNHPVVSRAQVWRHFLTCTDEKGWKRGKREAEQDKFKGGRFFLTVVTPPVPLEHVHVDKDIENFAGFVHKMDDSVKYFSTVVADQIKRYPTNFRKEYQKVSNAFTNLKEAFDNDGCGDSVALNSALGETGKAYSDIASMYQSQPRQDWIPLADSLHVYKGILSAFDNTLSTQKIASSKVRESQRLQEEGKMMEGEVQAITSHADAISYSLYAEVNHFQMNRQQEFKIMMQRFLTDQIDFYRRITSKLEEAKRHYDAF